MRIIETGYPIFSIPFESSQPSINEPSEVREVWSYVKNNSEQQDLLRQVLDFKLG